MGYLVEKIGYIMGISLGYDGISLDITIWQIVRYFGVQAGVTVSRDVTLRFQAPQVGIWGLYNYVEMQPAYYFQSMVQCQAP